jgi:glucosyl-3-phosphoglycerate phosphatase
MQTTGKMLLLRHGQSEWNAEGRWQGTANPPLSPLGEKQAEIAATHLREFEFERVIASDLQRAQQTASIIGDALSIDEIGFYANLRERDVGEWTGLTNEEIDVRYPEVKALRERGERLHPPGGETHEFDERAISAIVELMRQVQDKPIIVVTHGGFIRAIERQIDTQVSSKIPNLSGRWIVGTPEKLELGDVFSIDEINSYDEAESSQSL